MPSERIRVGLLPAAKCTCELESISEAEFLQLSEGIPDDDSAGSAAIAERMSRFYEDLFAGKIVLVPEAVRRAREEGAAVAFGLVAMAESIQASEFRKELDAAPDYDPCPACGGTGAVLCGGDKCSVCTPGGQS